MNSDVNFPEKSRGIKVPAKPKYDQARKAVRLDEASLNALNVLVKLTGKSESKVMREALIRYQAELENQKLGA